MWQVCFFHHLLCVYLPNLDVLGIFTQLFCCCFFYSFLVRIFLLITSVLVPMSTIFAYPCPHCFCFRLPNHFQFQIIVTHFITPGMRPAQSLENTTACPSTSSNLGNIGNQTNIVPHQFYKLQMGKILAEYIYCYIGRKKNH